MDQRLPVMCARLLVTTITPAAVASQKPCRRLRIIMLASTPPRHPETVASKGGRIAAQPHMQPSVVTCLIVNPMGYDDILSPTEPVLRMVGMRGALWHGGKLF